MEDSDIKITEEHDDHFLAKINDKNVKLYKINTEELEHQRKEDLRHLASYIDPFNVLSLLLDCDEILTKNVTIDKYKEVSENIVGKLKIIEGQILKKLNGRNICFYYIKQIDIEIYGKAHTLLKLIKSLYEDLARICIYMRNKKKWADFDPYALDLQQWDDIMKK